MVFEIGNNKLRLFHPEPFFVSPDGFEVEDETDVIDPQSFRVDVWDIKESLWRNMDFIINIVRF